MLEAPIRAIHSRQNSRVKDLRAALQRPGRSNGLIALEGMHLLEEALRSHLELSTVFVQAGSEALLASLSLPAAVEVLSLPAEIFTSALSTETPQPIAALARPPVFALASLFGHPHQTPLVLIAAGLQNPGNLGTLVRSAEAFGATGIALLPGTTSLWNAKTLRASSGSAFRLPVVQTSDAELLDTIRSRGLRLLAAVAPVPTRTHAIGDLTGPVAILIGNEGAGLPPSWIAAADAQITIPSPGPTESLNAAVAGSILLYEASRQRSPAS